MLEKARETITLKGQVCTGQLASRDLGVVCWVQKEQGRHKLCGVEGVRTASCPANEVVLPSLELGFAQQVDMKRRTTRRAK